MEKETLQNLWNINKKEVLPESIDTISEKIELMNLANEIKGFIDNTWDNDK